MGSGQSTSLGHQNLQLSVAAVKAKLDQLASGGPSVTLGALVATDLNELVNRTTDQPLPTTQHPPPINHHHVRITDLRAPSNYRRTRSTTTQLLAGDTDEAEITEAALKERIQAVFDSIDGDKNGSLDKSELIVSTTSSFTRTAFQDTRDSMGRSPECHRLHRVVERTCARRCAPAAVGQVIVKLTPLYPPRSLAPCLPPDLRFGDGLQRCGRSGRTT